MATKEQRAQLLKLLTSRDADTIRQGVELFVSLDDDELWSEVLTGASFDTTHERVFGIAKRKSVRRAPGRLTGTSFFSWNTRTSRWDELVLRLLVAHSSSPLKAQVVGLDLGGMVTSTSWLPIMAEGLDAFPNLAELVLYTGHENADLSFLGSLPSLRRLSVDAAYAYRSGHPLSLPDMTHLGYLHLTTHAEVTLGAMPALHEAVVDAPITNPAELAPVRALGIARFVGEDVLAHCPNVAELTCTDLRAPTLMVPTGARLVNGSLTVHNTLDLGNLATLTNLQSLVITPGDAPVSGLASLAGCADLRVLDIRGHSDIDDVSCFDGHPNLRMIAAHDTGLTKDAVPASMKNIVSFAAKPDLSKAVDRPAPGEKPAKRRPSKLSPAQRKTMAKLKKLIQATDMAAIMQAVELTVALDDDAIWGELLDGVTYEQGGVLVDKYDARREVAGRLIPNKIFTGTLFRQPWLDLGLAHLVARSDSPLRHQVTDLAIGQWSYSTAPLGALSVEGFAGFTNMRRLELLQASSYDLTALADIAALEEIDLEYDATVPGHAGLKHIVARRSTSFEPNGSWPALASMAAKHVDDLAPLAQGAPALQQLSVQVGGDGVSITGFEKLTGLTVTGNWLGEVTVGRCPALTEITTSGLHDVELLPALRRLTIQRATSLDFLAKVPDLEELIIHQPVAIDQVDVSTSAKLVGPLRLEGVRDLGNVADLAGLQILQLSKADEPLSLEPLRHASDLRVLDVRGCTGVTDLSPLDALPQLRMVAARDSGVESIPTSLTHTVSRAKDIDLVAAAAKGLPRKSTAKKKIPVPEAERSEWEAVLLGLATSGLDTALAAIDRAAALDHAGLEFLLSKVTILRDQLRSRAPFRLSTRAFLPPIVARILSHLPVDSVAAAPFRRMTKLVVEGERKHGAVYLVLDGLGSFAALDQVFVHKCRTVRCESIVDSKISVLAIAGGQVSAGTLPATLRTVLLEQVSSLDLAPFALSTIDELWLLGIIGNVDLAPLVDSPPQKIRLSPRWGFQAPIEIPAEIADHCSTTVGVTFKRLLKS